jgi:predicted nucleic acid-binding protein
MIYADTSFLVSFYAWDDNTAAAQQLYQRDRRRPLIFTLWQRFELRNALRLVSHRLKRARLPIRFQSGNVFREIEADLSAGRLKHREHDWVDTLKLAEDLSARHTEALGSAAVDLWHVAGAIILEADTFWTFDKDQRALARATRKFTTVAG